MLFGNNFKRIRKETKRYAQRRGSSDFSLLLAEVKCAVSILILNGYHGLPSRRNYWEQQPDMLTKIISDNMRRNRFEKLCSFFMLLIPTIYQKIQTQDVYLRTLTNFERISTLIACGIENLIQASAWWSSLVDMEPF